ncbi:MAG: proline racemase family protein [Paracoccaceae bacterium]|nr:proline racemase family protein [Paracoccaceae bacterium]
MRSQRVIHVISAHAEGEAGDVVVGGIVPPPGGSLWEQRTALARDGRLRNFLLNEPRGGVFRHVNLLVPPKHPEAAIGFIIMEPEDFPPMSGSNAICVATVLLDTGQIAMTEPRTDFAIEAPGGLVRVTAACRNGKAERITLRNLPSFACELDVSLDVPDFGRITVDTAFGGDSFVVVDPGDFGFELVEAEARRVAVTGMKITAAANRQLRLDHPELQGCSGISFCLFAGTPEPLAGGLRAKSVVVVRPGKVDRSPTGTAVSARMALMHARGELQEGQKLTAVSIIGSEFIGRIAGTTTVAGRPAIHPEISGRAWITGSHQHWLDPSDPWPDGYRLPDTWGHADD